MFSTYQWVCTVTTKPLIVIVYSYNGFIMFMTSRLWLFQARASGDYRPNNDNWKIGVSSIFADALGLAPFKDNFWTTTDQPGNPYGDYHTYIRALTLMFYCRSYTGVFFDV